MLTALVLATVCLPSERSADTSIYQFTLAQWLISSLLSACALNASLSPETLLQQVHHSTSSSLLSDCWKAEVTAASCAVGNIKQLFIHYDYCSCYLWNKNGAGRLRFFLLLTQFSQPRRALVQNPHRWLAKVKKTDISVLLGKGVDAQKCQSLLSQHLCDWTNLLSSSYTSQLITSSCKGSELSWMNLEWCCLFPYMCQVSFVSLFLGDTGVVPLNRGCPGANGIFCVVQMICHFGSILRPKKRRNKECS